MKLCKKYCVTKGACIWLNRAFEGEYMSKLVMIILVAVLAGCASMKPNYKFCKESDWRELGMRDAKSDKNLQDEFHQYTSMCKGFDESEMKPDLTMYSFGHAAGVKTLCTYTKGKEYGLSRNIISKNCDRNTHKDFYKGIIDGVNEYCRFDSGFLRATEGQVTSKVCSKNDHKEFYRGIAKGIKTYCTYQYGLKIGGEDKEYTGICKGAAEDEFIKGHTVGKTQSKVRKLTEENTNLKIKTARLEEQNRSLENQNSQLQTENYRLKNDNNSLKEQLKTSTATQPVKYSY